MARLVHQSGELTTAASPDRTPPTQYKLTKHFDILPPEFIARPAEDIKDSQKAQEILSCDGIQEMLEKALEAVAAMTPRRNLKYEIIKEANLVQVQVVDSDTGDIVRKIPADEIVSLVEHIRHILDDRLDVKA